MRAFSLSAIAGQSSLHLGQEAMPAPHTALCSCLWCMQQGAEAEWVVPDWRGKGTSRKQG